MVDAAVLTVTTAVTHGRTLSASIAGPGPNGAASFTDAVIATSAPDPGTTRVRKRGFVTGSTAGLVIAVNLTVNWPSGGPNAFLVDQAEIVGDTLFCQRGDSGALVLEEASDTAVGLLWGTNAEDQLAPAGKIAYMSMIRNVETALGVSAVLG